MDKVQQAIRSKKIKHMFFIALVVIMVGWVIFRFIAFASENARFVYNASRVAAENGLPVEYVTVNIESGTLYEPLSVKNNRAYVSGERASKMRAGQKIENGKINTNEVIEFEVSGEQIEAIHMMHANTSFFKTIFSINNIINKWMTRTTEFCFITFLV